MKVHRKRTARERLTERAREAINAVPEFPCIVSFGRDVPAHVELRAYDAPDERLGRPLGQDTPPFESHMLKVHIKLDRHDRTPLM